MPAIKSIKRLGVIVFLLKRNHYPSLEMLLDALETVTLDQVSVRLGDYFKSYVTSLASLYDTMLLIKGILSIGKNLPIYFLLKTCWN